MKNIYFVITLLLSLQVENSTSAFAASTPERTQQDQSWGSYRYKPSANSTVCYILSKPIKELPVTVNHGDNYFLITKRPEMRSSVFEPQLVSGFTFRPGSNIFVTVGSTKFVFFVKGNLAWLADPKQETVLIEKMKSGMTFSVESTSSRGTKTTHVYSLNGITSALSHIQECQ